MEDLKDIADDKDVIFLDGNEDFNLDDDLEQNMIEEEQEEEHEEES